MRLLILNGKRGGIALLDDKDYEKFNKFNWQLNKDEYISRSTSRGKKRKTIYLHREIMNPKGSLTVDHINGCNWDNRRSNLRVCTIAENVRNQRKIRGNYKGTTWDKQKKKWMAQIKHNYKHIFLGYFEKERDAALAYNQAAKKYFGEFAYGNQI